jgi:hypothetical protein
MGEVRGMFKDTTRSFIEYLNSKDIECVEDLKVDKKEFVDFDKIKSQVSSIAEFNLRTLGYEEDMNKKLKSNVGSTLEQYKIYTKKLKRYLNELRGKHMEGKLQETIYKYGISCLDRSNKCIDTIYQNDYLGLIKRSMDRKEVCLGNTYYNNLSKGIDEKIRIMSIDKCCYNMVETDLVYFLNRLKKSKVEINFISLIDDFCNMESLDKRSFKFISALLSYPYYSMKYYNKFITKVTNHNVMEFLNGLTKVMKKDRYNLV